MNEREFQEFFESFMNEVKKEFPNLTEENESKMERIAKRVYIDNVVKIKGDNNANTIINGLKNIERLHIEINNVNQIKEIFKDFDLILLAKKKFYEEKLKLGLKYKPIVNLSFILGFSILALFFLIVFKSIAENGWFGKPIVSNEVFQIGYIALAMAFIPVIAWKWYRNRYNLYSSLEAEILHIEANYPDSPIKEEVVESLKNLRRSLKILGLF